MLRARRFAEIDPEELYVFTETRPTTLILAPGQRALEWPANEFFSWRNPSGQRDIVILQGREPNLNWREYVDIILDIVGGTYLALGISTGVWDVVYLLCVPMLLLHFAIFYSFSTLLAVCTRSTVACVFGSILFWFLCWGMNFGRHAMVAVAADAPGVSTGMHASVEVGYWVLPKPADMGIDVRLSCSAGLRRSQSTTKFRLPSVQPRAGAGPEPMRVMMRAAGLLEL